jgi:hypothetical protein
MCLLSICRGCLVARLAIYVPDAIRIPDTGERKHPSPETDEMG